MNLTWHIVKKDAFRLRLLITFWAGALLAGTLSDAVMISADLPGPLDFTVSNFSRMIAWTLTVVLSAKLILEDPLATATVFWRTRPISGRDLLVAKAVGLGGLILLPLMLYLLLLLGVGVRGSELALTTADAGLGRAIVVVGIAALAAVSTGFGNFTVRALAVIIGASFIGTVAGSTISAHRMTQSLAPFPDTLTTSGLVAEKVLALAIGAGLLAGRYFRRPSQLAVVSVFVGAVLVNLTSFVWQWDFVGQMRERQPVPTAAEALTFGLSSPGLRILPRDTSGMPAAMAVTRVGGVTETHSLPGGEWLMPTAVYGLELRGVDEKMIPTGRAFSDSSIISRSPESLAPDALQGCLAPLRLMNVPSKQPLRLDLFTLPKGASLPDTPLHLRASLEATQYRFVIEAEVPASSGASTGDNRLRIHVQRVVIEDHELTFAIHERAFQPPLLFGKSDDRSFNSVHAASLTKGRSLPEDTLYVLANRGRSEAVLLQRDNFRRSALGGVITGWASLHFDSRQIKDSLDASWLKDATLLRIRAVEVGRLSCTLEASDLRIAE